MTGELSDPYEELLVSDYGRTGAPIGEQAQRWQFDSDKIHTRQKALIDEGFIICGLDFRDLGKGSDGLLISEISIKYVAAPTKRKGAKKMQCMFKVDYVEEYAVESTHKIGDKKGHIKKKYYYQECAGNSCPAWSDTLQDCRLALSGMESVQELSNKEV